MAGGDDVDLVVVDDDAEAVLRVEPGERLVDGLLGEVELAAALHRARPVEHEREVHGRPTARRVAGDGRRLELDEDEALGAAAGADQGAVGAAGQPGLGGVGHGGAPSVLFK